MIRDTKKNIVAKLKVNIIACKKCSLHFTRKNPVVGQGNCNAKIVMIGEAPGEKEDLSGVPFCGEAGKTLDRLFQEAKLNRRDIYITNILKCRPPNNRDPRADEIKVCSPFLDFQLKIIDPEIIVSLGRFSMNYILKKYGMPEQQISKAHGKVFRTTNLTKNIKVVPMFHPAVASYKPWIMTDMVNDFKALKKLIDNEKQTLGI